MKKVAYEKVRNELKLVYESNINIRIKNYR